MNVDIYREESFISFCTRKKDDAVLFHRMVSNARQADISNQSSINTAIPGMKQKEQREASSPSTHHAVAQTPASANPVSYAHGKLVK